MAYGTMGGDGQPQFQAAIFTRHVLMGRDLQESISAPRWLVGRTRGVDVAALRIESRFDRAVIDRLRRAGHLVEPIGAFAAFMGHAGAVVRHGDGRMDGATDPRSDGAALGV
jgi:gamma-glutamyltranspeptidase/glutathione hydrolase